MFSFPIRKDLLHHSRGGKHQEHEVLVTPCPQAGRDYAQKNKSTIVVATFSFLFSLDRSSRNDTTWIQGESSCLC